jgi:hypothetical protein
MFEILMKIWFFIAILPLTIAQEGWGMFKKFMDKGNRWHNLPYFLLIVLVVLLIILFLAGYKYNPS